MERGKRKKEQGARNKEQTGLAAAAVFARPASVLFVILNEVKDLYSFSPKVEILHCARGRAAFRMTKSGDFVAVGGLQTHDGAIAGVDTHIGEQGLAAAFRLRPPRIRIPVG